MGGMMISDPTTVCGIIGAIAIAPIVVPVLASVTLATWVYDAAQHEKR
jgi:hypothetical protein